MTADTAPMPSADERVTPFSNQSKWFWAAAGILFIINIALGLLRLPPTAAAILSLVTGVVFVSLPLIGLFFAASSEWKWGKALAHLAIGVALHLGSVQASRILGPGTAGVIVQALGQFGLIVWCAGLGACIALIIKDKNLILPVCIFLAGFDVFLIISPSTPVSQMVASNSRAFTDVAMKVPSAQAVVPPHAEPEEKLPRIVPSAYIGPADLLFSMAFFVMLFRFRMEVEKTARILVPVLLVYLALVFITPWGMLPALVPIGATVLIVNRKHFAMTQDEKMGTWLVGIIAFGLAAWGIYQRAVYKPPIRTPQAIEGPSSGPQERELLESDGLPQREGGDQPPSQSLPSASEG